MPFDYPLQSSPQRFDVQRSLNSEYAGEVVSGVSRLKLLKKP
jgi:hypothetical protein